MASWKEARESHRQLELPVRVPMRADLFAEITALEVQAKREREIDERENREPVAPGIAHRIMGLEEELRDSEVEFRFRALGRRRYNELLADHPPTDKQKQEAADADAVLAYNPDTFPPLLLAASCVEPTDMDVDDWSDIWENWSEGQVGPLWRTCLAANMGGTDAGPKSQIASAILNASAKS